MHQNSWKSSLGNVGKEGVTQTEILDLPINTFIHWLVWQAAIADGDSTDDLPPLEKVLPKPGIVTLMRASTKKELNGNYQHGASVGRKLTGAYRSWLAMRQRCLDPGYYKFHRYGGRGIGICARWMEFKNFIEDMGERPNGLSLERMDNDGDYTPENCRWDTPVNQAGNRRSSIVLTFMGKTRCAAQWARELGINAALIRKRFHCGLPVEDVLKKQ